MQTQTLIYDIQTNLKSIVAFLELKINKICKDINRLNPSSLTIKASNSEISTQTETTNLDKMIHSYHDSINFKSKMLPKNETNYSVSSNEDIIEANNMLTNNVFNYDTFKTRNPEEDEHNKDKEQLAVSQKNKKSPKDNFNDSLVQNSNHSRRQSNQLKLQDIQHPSRDIDNKSDWSFKDDQHELNRQEDIVMNFQSYYDSCLKSPRGEDNKDHSPRNMDQSPRYKSDIFYVDKHRISDAKVSMNFQCMRESSSIGGMVIERNNDISDTPIPDNSGFTTTDYRKSENDQNEFLNKVNELKKSMSKK